MGRKSNVTAPTLTIVDSNASHDGSPSTTPMRPTPLIGSWGDYEWGMDHKTAVLQTAQQNAEKKEFTPATVEEPDHMVLARAQTEEFTEKTEEAPLAPITEQPSQQQQETPDCLSQTQSFNEQYQHNVYNQMAVQRQQPQQQPTMYIQQQQQPTLRVGYPQPHQHQHQQPAPSGFKPLRAYVPQQRNVIEGHVPFVQVGTGFDNHSHHQRQMVPPAPQMQRSYHPNVNAAPQQQRNLPARGIHQHHQHHVQQQPANRSTQKPVQVSKFAPPPPPTARCDAVFMRDGSADDAFYNIVMRWYERAVISQRAHQGVPACPPAEDYLHDFPGWLQEVDKWWKANFANRKGRARLSSH